jgi:hypothetical protein
VVINGGQMLLYWHSNRSGRWRLWKRTLTAASRAAPAPVFDDATGARVPAARALNQEPAALVDASGAVRLFWRSQASGEPFQSRTVDTLNPGGWKPFLEGPDDRLHHTWDSARTPSDWYSSDTVGIYVSPPNENPTNVDVLSRGRAFIESFRPLSVRFVWFLGRDPIV